MRTLPVIEIFGPTIQGEGSHAGEVSHFVRFGGCDFRCSWCDTPHAVLPAEVRHNKMGMPVEDIVESLADLPRARWVVLTGGNPALHDLTGLVQELQDEGYRVSMETQGTRWQDYMHEIDSLCVSPKPPSSGHGSHNETLAAILSRRAERHAVGYPYERDTFLKVVVFTEEDYEFAAHLKVLYPRTRMCLSAGNDAGRTVGNPDRVDDRTDDEIRIGLLRGFHDLVERVLDDERMADVTVQAQQHVLVWANRQGV